MDPRSEVLLRQAELFQGNLLLVGLPADDLLGRLPNAHGWCWHAGDQAALDARFAERSQFGVTVPERAFDAAVIFLPKSKDLTDYLLNAVAARLPGAELFLVGEKKGGIESAAKQMVPFGKPRKLDSARHCQLWQVTVANAPQAVELESLAQVFDVPLAEGPLKVVSLPGVFSHGRLDRGTELLLEHLDKLPSGNLLDFGCGAGVLGAAVKRRYPHNTVTMLDVDAFAAASSRLTLPQLVEQMRSSVGFFCQFVEPDCGFDGFLLSEKQFLVRGTLRVGKPVDKQIPRHPTGYAAVA